MKNHLTLLLGLITAVLSLTSCEEMRQDMTFNKDGSGSVAINMVMGGEMMEMMKMMSGEGGDMFGMEDEGNDDIDGDNHDSIQEVENENMEESEGGEFSFDALFGDTKDTSMVFYDMIPDSLKGTIENEELLKQVKMRIASDEETKSISMGLNIDFDNVEQIEKIQAAMASMKDEDGGDPDAGELLGLIDGGITWIPGHLHMPAMDMGEDNGWSSMQEEMGEDGEGMMMMQMFMGELTFDVNITVPGKITKCECPEGSIDGNKVSYSISMLDMMTGAIEMNQATDIYYEH